MIKFSYNWLKDYVPQIPKPSKTADILVAGAFEVEDIIKLGDDFIFQIDILPNRVPDASGHRGLAKEIAVLAGLKFKTKKQRFSEHNAIKSKEFIEIDVKDKDCLLYNARVIGKIKVGHSPKWLKTRLETLGINSINNIVDAANYVMLDSGQPLHVFDWDKIFVKKNKKKNAPKKIIVRPAFQNENFLALDGEKYKLTSEDIVIADNKTALAIGGIKGGRRPEVDNGTKTIVLESANFVRGRIRTTSQRLNLATDSSRRFGAGLDPNLSIEAIDELTALIQKIAGGDVYGDIVSVGKKFPEIKHIIFYPDKARGVLGAAIADGAMKDIFERLGFSVKEKENFWMVGVQSIRRDIEIEEDLIEEIGRIYGYKKIKPIRPIGEVASSKIDNNIFFREKVRDMARAVGFDEVRLYSFVGEEELSLLSIKDRFDIFELENPVRPESRYLRPKLSPSLLIAGAEALKHSESSALFEIGRVYSKQTGNKPVKDTVDFEYDHMAFMLGGRDKNDDSFLEMKGRLDSFFTSLGLGDIWYDDAFDNSAQITEGVAHMLHPYRFAEIRRGKKTLGIMGEVHPDIRSRIKLKGTASLAELHLGVLLSEIEEEKEYRPISRFPALTRDIAIFVPLNTKVVSVLDVIENSGGTLLVDVDLFDIYEGKEAPEGKKNFAFRLVFQSHDKTLSDEEAAKIFNKIIKSLEKTDPSWEVRK